MSNDLLNTNIDGLFEKMNLEDIQNVLRKMRQEVDRKREELRVTVGSRYRDLIDAADTITDMKTTSNEVMEHLARVENKLKALKNRTLIGFQTDPKLSEKQRELAEAKKELQTFSIEIKLLIELPEMIWQEIDDKNIFRGSQIHQLGFDIYLGLTTFSGTQISNSDLQKWFPVVKWQETSLLSFNDIIPQEATKCLQTVHITPEIAADSLAALMLLQGKSSSDMLREFLRIRLETIKLTATQQLSTKQQVQQLLELLVSTLSAAHALFVEGFPDSKLPQAMLSDRLKSVSASTSPPTVDLLKLSSSIYEQLPKIVISFRPSYKECWNPLPLSAIRSECLNWFQEVKKVLPEEFRKLLSCVTQIKVVASLKDVAFNTLAGDPCASHWDELTQRLLGITLSVWGELLEPAVLERIEFIIRDNLCIALESLEKSVKENLTKYDLKSWLWTDTLSDLPNSSPALLHSSGVYMKTRCYLPVIQKLSTQWDQKLEVLLADLSHYKEGKDTNCAFKPFDKHQSRIEVYRILSQLCQENALEIVKFMKKDFDLKDTRVVFAMRLLTSLIDLCPNLRKCIELKEDDGKAWIEFVEQIRSAVLDLFNIWKSNLLNVMKQILDSHLKMNNITETLKVASLWDEITIQEEGESGGAVQSQIRVPMNPSFALQQSLFKISQEINQIGPHAIPKKAQLSLMEDTGAAILSCYDSYIQNYPTALHQSVALQLLFDVRFIAALLVARDNKPLQEKARSLCESLEGRVDPFDLDVFNPHIQSHVKRAVQRLQFVFCPLLTAERHAILWAARIANPAENRSTENPSVVALVSASPLIELLPEVGVKPKETIAHLPKTEEPISKETRVSGHQKKPSKSKNDLASITASARSSAAGFFEAVSSTWGTSLFGGEK